MLKSDFEEMTNKYYIFAVFFHLNLAENDDSSSGVHLKSSKPFEV
jgi:hypothetical protein